MEMAVYHVNAFWDEAVAVWVATSEDIPGLTTEADTIKALSQKLRAIVPELLLSNHVTTADYCRTGRIAYGMAEYKVLALRTLRRSPPKV